MPSLNVCGEWSDDERKMFLDALKERKTEYCKRHGFPIPQFDKAEDFYVEPEMMPGYKPPEKKSLDVTCGARTIWFDKCHPAAIYCDRRREEYQHLWKNAGNCSLSIDPDVLCDFTDLPFPSDSFPLVVFDPPHLTRAKETAWLVKKYGKLDDTWPQMLHDGFAECMRVLKPDGVLIFKWSEYDIPAEKVWRAIGQKPLFGHHSGRNSKTFWGCFMKFAEAGGEL